MPKSKQAYLLRTIAWWRSLTKISRLLILLLGGIFITSIITIVFLLAVLKKAPPVWIDRLPTVDKEQLTTDGFVKLKLPQREPPFFTLSPTTISKFGILPTETFILKARNNVDTRFIGDHLETNAPMTVTSRGGSALTLTPENSLEKGQAVRIKLAVKDETAGNYTFDRNYGWVYQVQGKFRVISYLPGDEKTDVPINTGIEITFSQDDYQNPESYIVIEPNIQYRLERHAETLAIVPLKPLEYKTVYKVTLKKGLNLQSRNDPIVEDFTFAFQTADEKKVERKPWLNLYKNFVQVSTKELPLVKVFTNNWKGELLKTKMFKFADGHSFLKSREPIDEILASWYGYSPEKHRVSVDNLILASQFDLPVETKDDLQYLKLPEPLSAGFYFIQFFYGDNELEQLWLQATDLAGYVAIGERKTTVWVNQLDNREPAGQATVRLVGEDFEHTTDAQGLAVFGTPPILTTSTRHYLEIVSQDDDVLFLPAVISKQATQLKKDDYWSYLYHERRLYKPNDTIYFWGVIKNRDTNQPPPLISVNLEGARYYSVPPKPVATKTLSPGPDGTFFESITFSELPSSWYHLTLKIAETEIESTGFRVFEYAKPEIKIEVEAPKKAIFSGEIVEFTARVTFYDETPANYLPLKVFEEISGNSREIVTDKQGQIVYKYQALHNDSQGLGSYQCITITPVVVQESKIEGQGCIRVFYNRLSIDTESDQQDNQATVKAVVHHVDLNKYNASDKNEYLGLPAGGEKIPIETQKTWWERIESGTYYDFIEKVTRPQYRYVEHEEKEPTKELITNNQGEIFYQLNLEERKSYRVSLRVTDINGHSIESREYFYYTKETTYTQPATRLNPELSLNKEENSYSLGEKVEVSIKLGEKEYPDTDKNHFLYIVTQRGEQEAYVEEKPHWSFAFRERHIPNSYVGAVIFTGSTYQIVLTPCYWRYYCSYSYYYGQYFFPGLNIIYKKEDRQLSLTLEYDKSIYRPSGEATVTVFVQNQNGKKIPNASVSFAAVDEALAALGAVIKPSILPSLYQNVNMGIYYSYHSHEPVFPQEPQAEKGGGGDGGRELFKDTAFFGETKTDRDGKAVFTFKLPDNITSWRVYAQAVTESMEAGQEEGRFAVTQDFFVVPGFTREFLEKDKPILVGSAFGKGLGSESSIDFQAAFYQGEKKVAEVEKKGSAFKFVDFPFPALSNGEYKLSLSGRTGEKQDRITLPFSVVDDRFYMKQALTKELKAGEVLTPGEIKGRLTHKPLTLVVSDQGKGKYYWQLTKFCYQESNRLEKNLAKKLATQILKEKFDNEVCPLSKEDLRKFQDADGGLSQVSWGASNLETTIWAIYVDPEPFDKEKLISYLEDKFNQKAGGTLQRIQSAWGLTSLGKPQIIALYTLADTALTFEEKIFIALALASAGETETAREIYYDILADYAYEHKPYIRIQSPTKETPTTDKLIKDTAMTLLLGKLIGSEYNNGLFAYVRDYRTHIQDIILDLGEIAFIKEALAEAPSEYTNLKYQSATRQLTQEMEEGGQWAIEISPNEKDNYSLSVLAGKAEVSTVFFIGVEGLKEFPPDRRLSLKRSYQKVKGEGDMFTPGDIVEVRLDFDFDDKDSPRGGYEVVDILPAGLAYLNNPRSYGLTEPDWPWEKEKNIFTFYASNDRQWLYHHGKSFIYYARVAGAGTFAAEPAIIQSNLDPAVFAYTDTQEITIEKPKD